MSELLNIFEHALSCEKDALSKIHLLSRDNQTFRSTLLSIIEAIDKTGQHIIFSGVGKSGYIARQIHSSFSSVGIPSFFLHPTEAAHGELGALRPGNFLLLFSKSGNTPELMPMLAYAKRHDLKTALITTMPASPLADQSNFTLAIPDHTESGLFESAPNSISLLFLAIGNAIATTISTFRNFSKKQFLDIHPAGTLGQYFLPLSQRIPKDTSLPLLLKEASFSDVILEMNLKCFACVGIIDTSGELIGEIRHHHLRHLLQNNADPFHPVKSHEIMMHDPTTLNLNMTVKEALDYIEEIGFSFESIFIVNENKHPVGILRISDLRFV